MTTNDIMKLCDQVREISYAIHVYHGNGYLEIEHGLFVNFGSFRFEIQKFVFARGSLAPS